MEFWEILDFLLCRVKAAISAKHICRKIKIYIAQVA